MLNKILAFFYSMVYALVGKLPASYQAQFNAFVSNHKGVTGLVIGMIVVLVACAVLIPIGVLITYDLSAAIPSLPAVQANSTVTSVTGNVYSAFSLAAVVPIVAAAGVIIAIIIGVFATRGARGGGGM